MLLKMIEEKWQIDDIIYCETGKEYPNMYKHIDKVEKYTIKYIGKKIIRLRNKKGLWEYWMRDHIKNKGKNKGKKGYGWPNVCTTFRWCTIHLKQKVFRRFIREKYPKRKVISHIGFTADEIKRMTWEYNLINVENFFPLIKWGITEKEALRYCKLRGFDWNGLYNYFKRVSCYCCPCQRIESLRTIFNYFPEQWTDMARMDEWTKIDFSPNYSLNGLEKKFQAENRQIKFEF